MFYNFHDFEIKWRTKSQSYSSCWYFDYKKVFTITVYYYQKNNYWKPIKEDFFRYSIKPYGSPDGMSEIFESPSIAIAAITNKKSKKSIQENIKTFVRKQSLKKIKYILANI